MKLLILTNNPDRPSFRQRIGVYLDTLQSSGIGCKCVVYPRANLARWKLLRHCRDFDAVFLHKKRLNALDTLWLYRKGCRVIYDFDDAVMYDDKQPDRPSRKRQNSFQRTVRPVHLVIAGNTYLAEHARKFNANVDILPTGLCLDEYHCPIKQEKDDNLRLVWIGSKSTLSHLASIKPALEAIGSRFDNVVLRIICDVFFDLQNMKVEKCRWSLQTQAEELVTSDIGLAPLPDNRFTRGKCGFKILQYQAASLPVVTSPVGVNAKYVQQDSSGYIATDKSDWVQKLSRLIRDEGLRKRMGRQGYKHVCSFDTRVLGARLVDIIKSVMT